MKSIMLAEEKESSTSQHSKQSGNKKGCRQTSFFIAVILIVSGIYPQGSRFHNLYRAI